MNPNLKYLAIALFLSICMGISALFLLIKGCNNLRQRPKADTKLEQKKSILSKEVRVLRDTQRIYVTKWRTILKKGDSVYVHIYHLAPDTCSSYIDTLIKQREIEKNEANLVHSTDSLIIYNLDSLNKINDILIGKYKAQVVLLCDSIEKHKCRRFKAFGKGVLVGFGISQGLQLIK
jgi:hypothetical protein